MIDSPLREHRKKLGQRGRQVAIAIGIDPSHYRRIEIGEVQASPEVANRIAKHFGNAVTRDQVLFPADYAPDPRAARKAS